MTTHPASTPGRDSGIRSAPAARSGIARSSFAAPTPPALPRILLARDYPSDVVRREVKQGRWLKVRRGAYVTSDGVAWAGADPAARRALHLARVAAVAAQVSCEAVISHQSAALVWGLPLWSSPRAVHVTQPHPESSLRSGDIVRHRNALRPEDVGSCTGLRVTSLARTLVDCATTLPPLAGLVTADAALRAGADAAAVDELLGSFAGRRGVRLGRMVARQADARSESPGESAVRFILWAYGFPTPQLQVPIGTRLGVFWVDLGWLEWGLMIEYDGLVKYRELAGGAPSEVVVAEKRRQDAIEEEGCRVLRVTRADLRPPSVLVARVLRRAPHGRPLRLSPTPELIESLRSTL